MALGSQLFAIDQIRDPDLGTSYPLEIMIAPASSGARILRQAGGRIAEDGVGRSASIERRVDCHRSCKPRGRACHDRNVVMA
jgi:hypothetical protein